MFWIVCDPSSGSIELCLTEIMRGGSQIFSCAWLVFGSVILNLRCVCKVKRAGSSQPVILCTHTAGSKLHCQIPTKHTKNICEPPQVISVKHSSVLPDDGSHTIRNMLE